MTKQDANLDEMGKILEQAFTDGASDTMWVGDRHIEIYQTAYNKLKQLITKAETQARISLVKQIISDIEDCGRPFTPLQDALDTVTMSEYGMESGDNTINQRMVLEYLKTLQDNNSEVA